MIMNMPVDKNNIGLIWEKSDDYKCELLEEIATLPANFSSNNLIQVAKTSEFTMVVGYITSGSKCEQHIYKNGEWTLIGTITSGSAGSIFVGNNTQYNSRLCVYNDEVYATTYGHTNTLLLRKFNPSTKVWDTVLQISNSSEVKSGAPFVYDGKLYVIYAYSYYMYLAEIDVENKSKAETIQLQDYSSSKYSILLYFDVKVIEDTLVYTYNCNNAYYTYAFNLKERITISSYSGASSLLGKINNKTATSSNGTFRINDGSKANMGIKLTMFNCRIYACEDDYYYMLKFDDQKLYKAKIYETMKTLATANVDIIVPENTIALSDNVEIEGNVCKVLEEGIVEIGIPQGY